MNRRSRYAAALLVLICVSCDGATNEGPSTTELELSTITGGPLPWIDPDGYQVMVDSTTLAIGVQATLQVSAILPGNHTFRLLGMAPNCGVNGSNPREQTAVLGSPLKVHFQIDCHEPTGAINLAIDFRSPGSLLDSLVARLDGGPPVTFAGTDTTRFSPVQAGLHTIVLSSAPTTCFPGGLLQTRTVGVGNQPVDVAFPVTCYVAGAGSIQVALQTTVIPGGNFVPSGFRVSLDDTLSLAVDANGSATFPNVPTGLHTLQVSAPFSCGASFYDTNRKTVLVNLGPATLVQFRELCIG